jgi:hypothetical protein
MISQSWTMWKTYGMEHSRICNYISSHYVTAMQDNQFKGQQICDESDRHTGHFRRWTWRYWMHWLATWWQRKSTSQSENPQVSHSSDDGEHSLLSSYHPSPQKMSNVCVETKGNEGGKECYNLTTAWRQFCFVIQTSSVSLETSNRKTKDSHSHIPRKHCTSNCRQNLFRQG